MWSLLSLLSLTLTPGPEPKSVRLVWPGLGLAMGASEEPPSPPPSDLDSMPYVEASMAEVEAAAARELADVVRGRPRRLPAGE